MAGDTASKPTADTDRNPEHVRFGERVRDLAAEARQARETFDPPDESTADERALECARDGVGPVVSLYIEARTGGRMVEFTETEFQLLHRTLNDWLTLYARCYEVDLDADFTIREAAEVLLKTHNVRDTAQLLTCVPARR
ncbi:hypothetical protein E6P09_13055 [Haloferax mediterranei ATCC 33500]|uniref:DUF8055 domain-containing protein n=1 Tax=Haloferax mediterranei (strain ATCC 33500 / DSM 1411 / JCM 8866 / NBRC 14739 / NCIMB 2177 / R-4) TaxID=523841 RepID=I3R861_HALMT|nr:hypothetical protein [Haloferax mediterranei]AFK20421.1 hypothetical protein HFX_2743 [Haloferax mediterranei ATCC 33500]ELZ98205.1 hypothetical protein C439_15510 [Haloferax mediterranei ATCC 33500]MDX5986823.1 hypothetical protein [Haloferax mediterranei ATCC 33500]QCQ76147.1 hypothetical protein E6P09_13055 [Haloferax mediterranei ATCC 33500]